MKEFIGGCAIVFGIIAIVMAIIIAITEIIATTEINEKEND